jgi:hypothetical protein
MAYRHPAGTCLYIWPWLSISLRLQTDGLGATDIGVHYNHLYDYNKNSIQKLGMDLQRPTTDRADFRVFARLLICNGDAVTDLRHIRSGLFTTIWYTGCQWARLSFGELCAGYTCKGSTAHWSSFYTLSCTFYSCSDPIPHCASLQAGIGYPHPITYRIGENFPGTSASPPQPLRYLRLLFYYGAALMTNPFTPHHSAQSVYRSNF